MNQFPLMRIQGRNALRVQAALNRGLSMVAEKNKEPKRQCNVLYNFNPPITNTKDRKIIVHSKPRIKHQACSDAQKLHWARFRNLNKLLDLVNKQSDVKNVRDAVTDRILNIYWNKKQLFDDLGLVMWELEQSIES